MSDDARGTPLAETTTSPGSVAAGLDEGPLELQGSVATGLNEGPLVPVEPLDAGAHDTADWGELSDAFLTIWLEPRETIRRIVSVNPRYGFLLLAALGGSATTLTPLPAGEAAPRLTLTLLLAATLGPLGNIAGLWFYAWAVRVMGTVFAGQAKPEEMRAALAWANAPRAAALPLALLLAFLLAPGMHQLHDLGTGLSVIIGIAMSLATIWSIVIASQAVAEVQGYHSAWTGFWNLLLPLLAILATLAVIMLPVMIRG